MKRDDNQAFWKEEYRTNISRVEIKNYITTSPKAIKEWDVSNKKNHSVMAWIESDGNDGYILYIAANGKIKMTNASSNNIFSGFTNMTIINATNLDILSIINLAYMFQNCSKLEKINLKYWDTSNITNTIGMFEGCSSLKSINLNGLNTDQLQKTNSMFLNCTSLSEIKFGDFKTNNVIHMQSMFKGCTSLKTVDVGSFATTNVTRMDQMFYKCSSLEGTLDLSNWNISNVETFSSMFFECKKIDKIIMPGQNQKATNVGAMFQGCWAKEIDISGITCQSTQSVHCMFHNWGMPNIEEPRKIDISSMVFDNITDHEYFIRDGYTSKDIVYVKDKAGQDFVIMQNNRNLFSTENVIIKTNE